MATAWAPVIDSPGNPIDLLEEMVVANEWPFDRASDDEMVVETTGSWCDYRLYFVWRKESRALHFTCSFDQRVPPEKTTAVAELLALVNERMWLGHFDVCSDERVPLFRYTLLTRGWRGLSAEQFEDIVDIALCECERFYPAFQFVLWGGKRADEAIAASMLDTVGEA